MHPKECIIMEITLQCMLGVCNGTRLARRKSFISFGVQKSNYPASVRPFCI